MFRLRQPPTAEVPPMAVSGALASPASRYADKPLVGIMLVIASTVFGACSDVAAKYLARTIPPLEVAWLRFACFVLLLLLPALLARDAAPFRSRRPALQLLRALFLVLSSVFFISSLSHLPVAEATTTAFMAPIFVTVLSIVFLGETVGLRRWVAALVGLTGVIIVVRPGTAAFHPAAVLALLSALFWACTLVSTRLISGADKPLTTLCISATVGFVCLSVLMPWVWVAPGRQDLLLGLLVGVASTCAQAIVVFAYRFADASVLAPFSYVQLVWVTLLGLAVFGDLPDVLTFTGAGFIIASGLYTAHRERIRRMEAARVG